MKIKVKKLNEDAKIPKFAHEGDAAMDMVSVEELTLKPMQRAAIKTGLSIELPKGYFANVRDRSGLAVKNGIHTLAGIIDSGYRGEYLIALINLGQEDFKVERGMRIAQLLIQKHETPEIIEVEELSDTSRGEGKFGSTGIHHN